MGGLDAAVGGGSLLQCLREILADIQQLVTESTDPTDQMLLQTAGGGQARLLLVCHALGQVAGVPCRHRKDAALRHIQQGVGLDGRHLAVVLQMDLIASAHLRLRQDGVLREQLHVLLVDVGGHAVHGVAEVSKAAAGSLSHPGVIVAVAVEDDALVGGKRLLQQLLQGGLEVLGLLQPVGELAQFLGHDGVQHHIGAGDGLGGAQHTEFELVAGKGQRRGAVAVRGVLGNVGHGIDANAQLLLGDIHVLRALNDRVQNGRQLITQKNGDDGRRGLVAAQTVVVAGI